VEAWHPNLDFLWCTFDQQWAVVSLDF